MYCPLFVCLFVCLLLCLLHRYAMHKTRPTVTDVPWSLCVRFVRLLVTAMRVYDTIRDAILTCTRKPARVSLIYRTEPTNKKCKNRKSKK